MSQIDILAALEAAPTKGKRRCKVATVLEGIPEDAPGREKLVHVAECSNVLDDEYRTAKQFAVVLGRLGTPVGETLIGNHRNHVCVCYR